MADRPKVGLALGGGAARGLAHIGVIRELEKNGIPVDFVAGTSIGSIVGALFCSGASMGNIAKLILHLRTKHLIDLSGSKKGLIEGKKIEELLRLLLHIREFNELKIPFASVATDLCRGERVVLKEGNIIKAIMASIAIPGVFAPINIEGRMLVDGGLVDRVPAEVVKEMGSDVVIGVDVGFWTEEKFKPNNMLDIMFQSFGIMEMQINKRKIAKCDVLIAPNVSKLSAVTLSHAEQCIREGEKAAKIKIDKIKELIDKRKACM